MPQRRLLVSFWLAACLVSPATLGEVLSRTAEDRHDLRAGHLEWLNLVRPELSYAGSEENGGVPGDRRGLDYRIGRQALTAAVQLGSLSANVQVGYAGQRQLEFEWPSSAGHLKLAFAETGRDSGVSPTTQGDLLWRIAEKAVRRAPAIDEDGNDLRARHEEWRHLVPPGQSYAGSEDNGPVSADRRGFDYRIGRQALKATFQYGGLSANVQVGYAGQRRLEFDWPSLAGNFKFSFAGNEDNGSEYRIEFVRRF
jgi:hypothetical protein